MSTITVMQPRTRSVLTSWLHTGNEKLFESDLRKNDDLRWSLDMKTFGFPVDLDFDPPPAAAPKAISRVDSYRVPPLKMTLETIQEDMKPPDQIHLTRSKSLPTQRRDHNLGLCRVPSYRPGQESNRLTGENSKDYGRDGTFFAGDDRGATFHAFEGGYGVSMSGPILSTTGAEYAKGYARRSHRLSRMRNAIWQSRLRGAVSRLLSRFRHSSRRSR